MAFFLSESDTWYIFNNPFFGSVTGVQTTHTGVFRGEWGRWGGFPRPLAAVELLF